MCSPIHLLRLSMWPGGISQPPLSRHRGHVTSPGQRRVGSSDVVCLAVQGTYKHVGGVSPGHPFPATLTWMLTCVDMMLLRQKHLESLERMAALHWNARMRKKENFIVLRY